MTFRRLAETARMMDRGDKRAITARAWLLMVACLVAGMSPEAAASDLCGTTILANLTLDHDLTCTGNGLVVGADGITINLNGHTISGPGSGVGISVSNRTAVLIVGGTVRNFLAGVQLVNSTAIVVKENRFTGNQDAVFLIGTSWSTVKENTAWQNTRVGVMLRPSGIRNSTQNVVVENTLTDAEWAEILEYFGHRCAYCLQPSPRLTIDHIVPLIAGGPHAADNVVPACPACNSSKGKKSLLEFLRASQWGLAYTSSL